MAKLGVVTLDCGCRVRLVSAPLRREEDGKPIVDMSAEIVAPCDGHGRALRRPKRSIWPRTRRPNQPRRVDGF